MYSDVTGLKQRVDRWRLTGTIRTLSPVHVGDGGEASREKRSNEAVPARFATVFADYAGRPILPASSIKGALRAWARAHGIGDARTDGIFGHIGEGSGVTIHDAVLTKSAQPVGQETRYSYWNSVRGTALLPHVVIDPRTGAAAEKLLYHVEFVPAGSEFTLRLTGQGISDEVRRTLLYILEQAFKSHIRPARLGREIANGWGNVEWQAGDVEVLNLPQWLAGPAKHWCDALTRLNEPERGAWLAPALPSTTRSADQSVIVRLRLHFEGPMLINDPTRERKADSKGRGAVGRAVVRRLDGLPYLPASSIRGAFRARARRIWQTLAWGGSQDLKDEGQQSSAPQKASEQSLASFLKMFGATGWRSPFEIGDFDLDGVEHEHVQEFVAIDRFTGSVAGDKKYNAHGLLRPIFHGDVRIRADRWKSAGAGPWTWLLLLWTLRDWAEGDGSIGSGSAKGWGRFHAEIHVAGSHEQAQFIQRVLNRDPAALADKRLDEWEMSLLAQIGKGVA